MISDNVDGLWACEFNRAVEYARADGNVSRLRVDAPSHQAGAGEHFEPIHGLFGKRTTVITAALLPFSATGPSERIDRFVTPCDTQHVRPPVSGTIARRETQYRLACRNYGMAGLGVVSTIAVNYIGAFVGRKQIGEDIAVGDVLKRHQDGTHLSCVREERDTRFASGVMLRMAMLANLPFARAVDLHTRAADHQIDRFVIENDRQLGLMCLGQTVERCVVRRAQGGERQIAKALREALQGAQPQAERGTQTTQHLNQCITAQTRTAPRRLNLEHARNVDPTALIPRTPQFHTGSSRQKNS